MTDTAAVRVQPRPASSSTEQTAQKKSSPARTGGELAFVRSLSQFSAAVSSETSTNDEEETTEMLQWTLVSRNTGTRKKLGSFKNRDSIQQFREDRD